MRELVENDRIVGGLHRSFKGVVFIKFVSGEFWYEKGDGKL
ncbi:hypothetical protein [Aliarcobacter butzleri]